MLRDRHVGVDDSEPNRWVVDPGPIAALDVTHRARPVQRGAVPGRRRDHRRDGQHPALAGIAPTSPATLIRDVLTAFGADGRFDEHGLTVRGTNEIPGVDLDLRGASELTPVVAAVAALADRYQSHPRRRPHPRPRDRPAGRARGRAATAWAATSTQTDDGLTIHPRLLGGAQWQTYADHRMAQAGALLGLVVPDIELDDIGCTTKTMPEFAGSG